jgi:hypothetical protein
VVLRLLRLLTWSSLEVVLVAMLVLVPKVLPKEECAVVEAGL